MSDTPSPWRATRGRCGRRRWTTAPAWLHNMCVPSRSTLTVRREWLGGRCFDVCPRVDAPTARAPARRSPNWTARALRDSGTPALLALLLEPPQPAGSWQQRVARQRRRLARQADLRARVDEAIDRALSDAGVPRRVGVFVPRGAFAPEGATRLGFAASLAVLGRRSGPLYLPDRQVDGSLVGLCDVLLVFPGEGPGDAETGPPALP